MADNDDPEIDALSSLPPEELSEELARDIAKRWDPERLMQLVAARAGKGEQLDHTLRNRYEKKLGIDLGHVRIITGTFAEEFNRSRNAEAVTIGGTGMILMGNAAERSMATAAGQGLLAHELTHVAQAERGLHRRGAGNFELASEEHEAEAHEAENAEIHSQHGEAHSNAHHELAKVEGEREKEQQLHQEVMERVLGLLGDAARTHQERSGPRWRRP
ncbi:MAG TPA: DUF4157 domain-containing protein [Kofleriaceae bacterium]|nr:DUF4157 domain-containing protein [Kofleriaceae bacterium]